LFFASSNPPFATRTLPAALAARWAELRHGVAELADDRRGAAILEFALMLPVIVALLVGMVDYGALAYQTMQVSAAAHAGAEYVLHYGWNATAVQTAVTSATSLTVTASPAPQLQTACVTGGAVVVTAGTSCPSGAAAGSYVLVSAQASFSPIIAWSSFAMPSTIAARAMIRIQ
jgi:Flp pilus assembly protein TadG